MTVRRSIYPARLIISHTSAINQQVPIEKKKKNQIMSGIVKSMQCSWARWTIRSSSGLHFHQQMTEISIYMLGGPRKSER